MSIISDVFHVLCAFKYSVPIKLYVLWYVLRTNYRMVFIMRYILHINIAHVLQCIAYLKCILYFYTLYYIYHTIQTIILIDTIYF
jgi:hypothetical protein